MQIGGDTMLTYLADLDVLMTINCDLLQLDNAQQLHIV